MLLSGTSRPWRTASLGCGARANMNAVLGAMVTAMVGPSEWSCASGSPWSRAIGLARELQGVAVAAGAPRRCVITEVPRIGGGDREFVRSPVGSQVLWTVALHAPRQ